MPITKSETNEQPWSIKNLVNTGKKKIAKVIDIKSINLSLYVLCTRSTEESKKQITISNNCPLK